MGVTHTLQGCALSPHCPGQGQEQRGGIGATRTWGCSSGTNAGWGCECVSCSLGCPQCLPCVSCRFVHLFSPALLSWCPARKIQHCLHPISRTPGAAAGHRDCPEQGSHLPHAQILWTGDRDISGCKSLKFFTFAPMVGMSPPAPCSSRHTVSC